MKKTMLMTIALTVFMGGAAFAGSDPKPQKTPPPTLVEQRLANQQKRIDAGTKNGSLTSGEAFRLQSQHDVLVKADKDFIAGDGAGKLTPSQRKSINAGLNQQSKQIYILKHNKYKIIKTPKK